MLRKQRKTLGVHSTFFCRTLYGVFSSSGLINTLQQKQKCLEYKEVLLSASSTQKTENHADPHQPVALEHTSDTLSYDSKDPLLSSVKPQCLSTNIQSYAAKLSEVRATSSASSFVTEHSNRSNIIQPIQGTRLLSTSSFGMQQTAAVQPVVKTPKSKPRSKSKKKRPKPFIEHQEDKRTSFSRASFVTLQERLSADEMSILSELARALSLPEDVRRSLHAYLDKQRVVDVDEEHSIGSEDSVELKPSAKSKTKKKVSQRQLMTEESVEPTPSEPFWNVEDVKEPERLKMMLERTAKLLNTDKKQLLEQTTEHERQMKENAYHDRMASFVELCINTGMVSTE